MKFFNSKVLQIAVMLLIVLPAWVMAATMTEGTVMGTGPANLFVMTKSGEHIEFAVSTNTRIMRDGQPAKIDELQPRDHVSVAASEGNDSRVATEIIARTPF